MMLPTVGLPAPWPSGQIDQDGRTVDLCDLHGQWVVLYFFAGVAEPAPAQERAGFSTALPDIDARIYGVSLAGGDGASSFIQQHGLAFDVLADPQRELVRAYGLLRRRGRQRRSCCVLIDREGRLAHRLNGLSDQRLWEEVCRICACG